MITTYEYEIVPVTIALINGEFKSTECTDEQAMEWYIYATRTTHINAGKDLVLFGSERKLILHAVSREIADAIVCMFEVYE